MNNDIEEIIKDGEEEFLDYPYLGIGKKPSKGRTLNCHEINKLLGE